MNKLLKLTAAMITTVACSMPLIANASVIALDFDTLATGAGLGTAPLTTVAGNVALVGTGSRLEILTNSRSSNGILHRQITDSDRAGLDFSFDVNSITFDFAGEGIGAFLAQAFDSAGSLIDTYTFSRTICTFNPECFDGVGVVLAGEGIRSFRFADAPNGGAISFVDNVRLSYDALQVPEPGSFALLGIALAGLGATRRRKQKAD